MSRPLGPAGILLAVMLCLLPGTSEAQIIGGKRLIILPFASSVVDSALTLQVHQSLLEGLRILPGISLASEEDTHRLLGTQSVETIIGSASRLHDFAVRTGSSLLVAGIVNQDPDGAVELTVLMYSRDERRVRDLVQQHYDSTPEAIVGARELGRAITHPRNLSPSDTPFLLSMLIPGLGQISQGAPRRGMLAAGLVAGTLAYGLTTPRPDRYKIDFRQYRSLYNSVTRSFLYYHHQQPVSAEAFFASLSADRARYLEAEGQRRAVDVRRRRALGLFVAAYLYNLADTALLTRREVETDPFFLHLESIIEEPLMGVGSVRLGLRLGWRIP